MANIRKRGDKWQVQVRRQGFPSRTQSFCRQEEAKAWGRAQELAMDHGPGLLEPFLNQIWTLFKGWGRRTQGLAPRIDGLLDWLADLFSR